MKPQEYQAVKEVFVAVCDLTAPERSAYLDKACANDGSLRVEVERLLAAHDQKQGVLKTAEDN